MPQKRRTPATLAMASTVLALHREGKHEHWRPSTGGDAPTAAHGARAEARSVWRSRLPNCNAMAARNPAKPNMNAVPREDVDRRVEAGRDGHMDARMHGIVLARLRDAGEKGRAGTKRS